MANTINITRIANLNRDVDNALTLIYRRDKKKESLVGLTVTLTCKDKQVADDETPLFAINGTIPDPVNEPWRMIFEISPAQSHLDPRKDYYADIVFTDGTVHIRKALLVFGVTGGPNNSNMADTTADGSGGSIIRISDCGSNTLTVADFSGERGPQGIKGDKGDIGPVGPQGDIGPVGPQGEKGIQGDIGPQGAKGNKGDKGDTGFTGPKGDKGDTGPRGLIGPTGDEGIQGPKGDRGDIGPQGDIGPVGPRGLRGLQGPKGDKGDIPTAEMEAYKNATKGYRDEAEGFKDDSETAEGKTTQAYQDFLNQLGTEVATLTDGKLTPSQIPALALNDVFEVDSVNELLTLTAERGDVGLIMGEDDDENPIVIDSYMLALDDPTVLANWKKLGISYVANAGHAQTAGFAENSNKINGHRLITMTETQYAGAVLEEETLYAVYPD